MTSAVSDLQRQHEVHDDVHAFDSVVRVAAARFSGGAADGGEIGRLQRRAADQAAVDVGLGEQLRRVVGLDAAAVEDLHAARHARAPRVQRARRNACTACACSGVAVLPVPIAQTGS